MLRIFRPAVRDAFTPQSDIDVPVAFEGRLDPDLLELGGLQQGHLDLFGRKVDLRRLT